MSNRHHEQHATSGPTPFGGVGRLPTRAVRPRREASALREGLRARFALALLAAALVGAADSDDFLEGYASAILERDLGLSIVELSVSDGRAKVVVESLGDVNADRVVGALQRIDGIDAVTLRTSAHARSETSAVAPEQTAPEDEKAEDGVEILPRRRLFDPLLADPREPHFSASVQWYRHDRELDRVGAANFGGSFALLGGPLGEQRWELGLLAGVFSIFDLDAPSLDLVNADYLVGPTVSLRRDRLSGQLRLYHQSSHLGDEYLLRNRTERVNLSYEGLDALVSFDLHPAVRLYAGGGAIFHSEPNLDPWSAQTGIEVESPWTFLGGAVRPIAAGDFQFREENDWRTEISGRGGFQIENPALSRLRVLLLFEYFRGNSPNGQFFQRRIEYLGGGVHLYF